MSDQVNLSVFLRAWLAACLSLGLMTSLSAQESAQEDASEDQVLEEVTVTGSRISAAAASVSPVIELTAEDFYDSPSVNIADFLAENVTANNGILTEVEESAMGARINGDPRRSYQPGWPGFGKHTGAGKRCAHGPPSQCPAIPVSSIPTPIP